MHGCNILDLMMINTRENMLQAAVARLKTRDYKVLYFKRHACLMVLPFVLLLLCFMTGIRLPYNKLTPESALKLEDSNPCLRRASSYDQLRPIVMATENSLLLPAIATSKEGQKGRNEGKKSDQHRNASVQEGCQGKLVYTYALPAEFNEELVHRCKVGYKRYCDKWFCVPCNRLENYGFGPMVQQDQSKGSRGVKGEGRVLKLIPEEAWYRSDQFSVEVIFREKMKRHVCVTEDAREANAFYIPFYGGLDAGFTLFSNYTHVRDELTQRLVGWLSGNPVWQTHKDAPHFMVLGHVAWDFDRKRLGDGWGSSLFRQPLFSNVTRLLIERKFSPLDMGLPFPTLFHPSSPSHIFLWQEEVRKAKRPWLVTFVGGSSRKFYKERARNVRRELMKQCKEAEVKAGAPAGRCRAVECLGGEDYMKQKRMLEAAGDQLINEYNAIACEEEPEEVVRALTESIFCLQPQGDSATRKGFFDTIVAGCIPVLFANTTAYRQYLWHLPSSPPSLYSVYIPEADVLAGHVDVIRVLSHIPVAQVESMQRAVRHLIPRVIYSPPGSALLQDAFSIALDAFFMQHTS